MFVLGHVGIGPRLLLGLRRRLPARWLVLGCLLPDLIDKPLFYGLLWTEGHADALIAGSRSVGHSGVFFLLLLAAALVARRPPAWALLAGVATHLGLDILGELIMGADAETSIWLAVLFPLLGWQFPKAQFSSMLEHLRISAQSAYVIAGEILGAAILLRDRLRRPQSS
ncbi:MAG TPA: hypothetical protein VI356_19775 [Myxococcales bacterium]